MLVRCQQNILKTAIHFYIVSACLKRVWNIQASTTSTCLVRHRLRGRRRAFTCPVSGRTLPPQLPSQQPVQSTGSPSRQSCCHRVARWIVGRSSHGKSAIGRNQYRLNNRVTRCMAMTMTDPLRRTTLLPVHRRRF